MANNKSTSNIRRISPDKGNYATLNNQILLHQSLSSDAKVLLQILLNNQKDWNIVLNYYSEKFKWGRQKQARVVKELVGNGYLKIQKFSKGRGKGFAYVFTISEYGDLGKKNNVEISPVKDSVIVPDTEGIKEMPNPIIQSEKAQMRIIEALITELESIGMPQESTDSLISEMASQVLNGTITLDNYINEINNLKQLFQAQFKVINAYVYDNLNGGTSDNRKEIKKKFVSHFKQEVLKFVTLDEREMKRKLTILKMSIIGANKKNLSDYSSD